MELRRFLFVLAFLWCFFGVLPTKGEAKEISLRRYVAGSVIGSSFGLGLGHFVQGRVLGGVGFLLLDFGSVVAGYGLASRIDKNQDLEDDFSVAVGFSTFFALIKIAQILSVCFPGSEYNIVSLSQKDPPFQLAPLLTKNYNGLQLRYSF